MEARTRGITICCVGSTAISLKASSWPDISMDPISTVNAVPTREANKTPVIRTEVSLNTAKVVAVPVQIYAPNCPP